MLFGLLSPGRYRLHWDALREKSAGEARIEPTIRVNPVSKTAYYTLMMRVWDAERLKPLCADTFAQRFVDEGARASWERFRRFKYPNASNAARHRIIDDYLRRDLMRNRDAPVIVVGCGFDTRPYRFPCGHWIELDEPAILNYKEARLPTAKSRNPLVRIPIDFSRESLEEKLQPFATGEHALVVLEGVSMYLTREQTGALIGALKRLFPQHTLYCDLMRKSFLDRYGRGFQQAISQLGAQFAELDEAPQARFEREGYRSDGGASIALRCAELGGIDIPLFVIRHLPSLRDGFRIWRFRMPA